MNNVEMIIAVLHEKAEILSGWEWAYTNSISSSEDRAECRARAASYRDQSGLLAALAKEFESALTLGSAAPVLADGVADWRRVIIAEMTGPMQVYILPDPSSEVVQGHSVADHEALLESGEGQIALQWVEIPARARSGLPAPSVDIRYACIEWVDGGFSASIHNSAAEAELRRDVFEEEHSGFDFSNNVAECAVHPVVIPQRR